jgi:hypothetical protein
MNMPRCTGIRRVAVIVSAVAALAFFSTAQANAHAGATSKDPAPTKTGQGVPDGTDAFRTMRSAIGLTGMKNQEDLNAFKTWLIARPHIADQGFYESAVDIPARRMTLQWHGDSPLQAQAVAEGQRRGLTVVIKREPYTRASVERATRLLLDPRNSASLHGFHVTSVAGPTVANDRLTVAGVFTGQAHTSAADVSRLASPLATSTKSLTGLDATFTPGSASVPYSTRSTDFSPFNAGGMMRGNNGTGCTSGFGIKRSGYTWTTTARHCDADSWTAWDNGSASYGSRYSADAGTGARMLTGDGFFWMFDGAWNDSSGYHKTVWGLADVSQGSSICSSGANSGVHCNLIVDNMVESFNDGYGTFSTIRVHAQSGIAGAHGDSGGPMLIPSSDGTHVWAVGILQGSNETQTSSCGSLRISTTCSAWVEFTSERVFLNNMGATLYTG